MVICLERGADLHTAQLMPLPLIDSCFSKIQIGFTFLVPADPGSPGKGPLNVCSYHVNRYSECYFHFCKVTTGGCHSDSFSDNVTGTVCCVAADI